MMRKLINARSRPMREKPDFPARTAPRTGSLCELELLRPTLRAIVVLGAFAWQALLPILAGAGWRLPRPRPVFGHGAEALVVDPLGEREVYLIGGYHPSQRNMFTRTLTPVMLRDVLRRGAEIAGLPTLTC
jgi:uracil-DNA glycosylase